MRIARHCPGTGVTVGVADGMMVGEGVIVGRILHRDESHWTLPVRQIGMTHRPLSQARVAPQLAESTVSQGAPHTGLRVGEGIGVAVRVGVGVRVGVLVGVRVAVGDGTQIGANRTASTTASPPDSDSSM